MKRLDVVLVEWPLALDGGPRLVGRTGDPAVIEFVREHLAAARRRDLARLERPVRLVPEDAE